MTNEKYQGWANAQTWSVALTFDNTKVLQDKIISKLKITNDFSDKTPIEVQRENAHKLILEHGREIIEIAPWVWEGKRFPEFVEIDEIINHFLDKS
jgi:hypothetical protein